MTRVRNAVARKNIPKLYEVRYRANGDPILKLQLHDGQAAAWNSQTRFCFVVAGTQSGKTSFGPWWLWREMENRGPGDYLAITTTYDLFKLKMLPALTECFVDVMKWGTYHARDQVLVSNKDPDWRIILRSSQSEGGLEAATAKGAWLDECGMEGFGLTAWEAIQRRLSLHQGRVLGTTTIYNLGWLYTEAYKRYLAGDLDYDIVQFASTMNPAFPRAEYERARRTLPDWRFRMFYDAEFVKPAGLIYRDYDEGKHMVKPFPVPRDWKRYVGVDPGIVNTGIVWLAEVPLGIERRLDQFPFLPPQARIAGNLFMYREALGGGLTAPEHARACLEYAEPVALWMGAAHSEPQRRKEWQYAGVPLVEPSVQEVEPGIDRVTGLFKQNRLFVFETCSYARAELGTYSRELDSTGTATEKIADKQRYHVMDALRYIGSALGQERPEEPKPEPEEVPPDDRHKGSLAARLGLRRKEESPDEYLTEE
jgi:hypothetical protein